MNDALNCEDLTPEDIHDTIVKCVDESVEYHKKYLTKSVELLSLLKGNRSVDFDAVLRERSYYEGWDYTKTPFSEASEHDWEEFWKDSVPESSNYSDEVLDAMCDKAASDEEKEKCREYNLREAEYYNKRAQLDADYAKSMEEIKMNGGYEWTPQPFKEKAKTHDEMVADGWTMTSDGFWIKD
jgi:hypothetical protein